MKKLVIILFAFSLLVVLGCATSKNECPVYVANPNCKLVSFKPGSEPEGYNGIKWETKLSALERMKHIRTDPTHGGIEFYVRQGDTFKLENEKHKPVQCHECGKGKIEVLDLQFVIIEKCDVCEYRKKL